MLACAHALDPARSPADRPAVRAGGAGLTYGEMRELADRVATAARRWSDQPVGKAPFAGVLSEWTPEFIAAFLGLASAGWAVGVLDPSWTAPELAGAIGQLDPAILLVDDARSVDGLVAAGWDPVGAVAGWRALARGTPVAPQPPAPAHPAGAFYVGFTSGTSARPKAFRRSHRSWWHSFEGLQAICPLVPGTRVLVPGALSASHFLFGALHALHVGATVELITATDLTTALRGDDTVGAVYVVPTMLARLPEPSTVDRGPAFAFCAGARLDPLVRAHAEACLPDTRIVQYYGASELSFVTIQVPGDGTPPGSVGRAFPGVEVSVRGEDGQPLGTGATGLLYARSRLVFDGYRGAPPGSAARRLHDGWWTVGDRGRIDAAGNVFVEGRGSDLVITGGVNVQPEDVEEALALAHGVAGCVVVGVPDTVWGEVVCAAVVARPGALLRRSELRSHAASMLAPHKRPRRYVQIEGTVPLGRSGKVDRAAIRDAIAAGRFRELR